MQVCPHIRGVFFIPRIKVKNAPSHSLRQLMGKTGGTELVWIRPGSWPAGPAPTGQTHPKPTPIGGVDKQAEVNLGSQKYLPLRLAQATKVLCA